MNSRPSTSFFCQAFRLHYTATKYKFYSQPVSHTHHQPQTRFCVCLFTHANTTEISLDTYNYLTDEIYMVISKGKLNKNCEPSLI